MKRTLSRTVSLLVLILVAGCFDKGGGSKSGTEPGKSTPTGVTTTDDRRTSGNTPTPSKKTLSPPQILVAQTHLIPVDGLRWPDTKLNPELNIAANRETLVAITFNETDVIGPILQVWNNAELTASFALSSPDQAPTTEGGDPAPEDNMWHAYIPAELVQNGLSLSISSNNYADTKNHDVLVGPETTVTFNILPFFLFGATEANTDKKFDEERLLSFTDELIKEAAADLPWSHTSFRNHPARQFVSDFLVIPPRNGKEAYVAHSTSDTEGTDVIDTVNNIVRVLHTPSGDETLNNVTYGSIIALNHSKSDANKLEWIGRGVSYTGSGTATSGNGGSKYGFLWHEGGHAVGLGHSQGEYMGNWFPYPGGSTKGSSLGFSSYHKAFRSTLVPLTSPIFMSCRQIGNYQKNDDGRCYRQDPMDNADGGSAPGNKFTIFSDYNAARMQMWAQNRKKIDPSSPTNFSRWDSTTRKWVSHTPTTQGYGDWAINENLPVLFNEPVARVNLTYSKAGTAGVSRFYPTMYSIENSIKTFDPLDRASMDSIYPTTRQDGSTPKYKWYCHIGGCDYSVRVTFSDGTVVYRLIKGGFRKTIEEFGDDVDDPFSSKSFKFWSINIPRAVDATVTRLELLDTPKVWSLSAEDIINAPVLMTESF